MKNSKLDFAHFHPEVFQAVAGKNFTVYAYMNDGNIRLLDMKPLIKQGGVFKALKDENMFREKLTVLNSSVAWDIAGSRNEYKCIDVDPFSVFECPVVPDIPEESAEPDELELIAEAKADTSPTVKHEDINWY